MIIFKKGKLKEKKTFSKLVLSYTNRYMSDSLGE